ncbi:purine-nucleoside phosphorylase [Candidatus Oleimmundimicrobium sp.]|uniref:purine-nucleoside phosphorylase n=1 Tax=Candidatus Oleimmundimicrobium sp. TaxID=3060597 RepID=UPI002719C0BB|nr:purine-nucleoside phosphorylase [Candidatus Oleimmundimicrobium sp.]MDO8886581.1 purine-nucleoside phosphorylase [Candidatus Oleimmundimicrobium sp.]
MDPREHIREQVKESAEFIKSKITTKPKIGIILGSGLGDMANDVTKKTVISYEDIPNFPIPLAPGHKGNLFVGELENKEVFIMQGRAHYYEGYTMFGVTLPIRVLSELGVEVLIITNSAGGLNDKFSPGDFMIIKDHINLFFNNPLIGRNDERFGPRFVNMVGTYDEKLRDIAKMVSDEEALNVKEGIYAGASGPCYETPAEAKFISLIGADAVGMSTVPEVIVAAHSNLRVLGISCITNSIQKVGKVSHNEVLVEAKKVEDKFRTLIRGIIKKNL